MTTNVIAFRDSRSISKVRTLASISESDTIRTKYQTATAAVLVGSLGCGKDKIVPMNKADDAIWAANPNLPVMEMGDARVL